MLQDMCGKGQLSPLSAHGLPQSFCVYEGQEHTVLCGLLAEQHVDQQSCLLHPRTRHPYWDQLCGILNLLSGYWQVEINPADGPNSVWLSEGSLYIHCHAFQPTYATFQQVMDSILAGLRVECSGSFVSPTYLDYINVICTSFEEDLNNQQVFFHLL